MGVPGIKSISVIGAGTMGRQIAFCAALAGYKVHCIDRSSEVLEKVREFADNYLSHRLSRGKISQEKARAGKENLFLTDNLKEAVQEADLVIESIPEVLELKRDLFSRLDSICPARTLLVTNSSFVVSSRIADVTARPDKICNMHFFNPPLAMAPVEVVKGPHTSDETVETIAQVCKSMGKIPIMLEKEIHGFLVNRILSKLQREALFLYESGIASYKDIDTAVTEGLGYRIPPFRQMDLIGLDLVLLISREHFRETGDYNLKPSPTVVEMVTKNKLGRKTGEGFYDYSDMLAERGY